MTMHVVSPEIDQLTQLYRGGFQNHFLDNALRKIVHHQITRDEADLRRVQEALAGFEAQYGLSSTDFRERFQVGWFLRSLAFQSTVSLPNGTMNIHRRADQPPGDGPRRARIHRL